MSDKLQYSISSMKSRFKDYTSVMDPKSFKTGPDPVSQTNAGACPVTLFQTNARPDPLPVFCRNLLFLLLKNFPIVLLLEERGCFVKP
jgi:hypothetical protein